MVKKAVYITLLAIVSMACSGEESVETIAIKEVQPVKAAEIESVVASLSGEKAVLVNVWATWCVPCVEEFPHIVKVQKEFRDDLQVVFISADFPEEIDRIHGFLKEQGVDWQTYIKDDRDEPFIDAVWPQWTGAIPASVIYNKDGTNLTFFERSATYEEFRELIAQAINNN